MKTPIDWGGVRGTPSGHPIEAILSDGVMDRASNSGNLGGFWTQLTDLCSSSEANDFGSIEVAGQWLEKEIGGFVEYWRTMDRFVRRAWLGLAIIGMSRQRPGGYTVRDIGSFAKVRSRGARRRVVRDLVDLGVLEVGKERGRQPRYKYTGSVSRDKAWAVRNEFHRARIRRLLRTATRALPGRAYQLPGKLGAGTEEGWEWFPPDAYVVGSPRPPVWFLDALWAALPLAQQAIEVALSLPPSGRLRRKTWNPNRLWQEIRKESEIPLRALCDAAWKVDKDQFKMWMRRLLDAEDEPVLLAPLADLTLGMLISPDDL